MEFEIPEDATPELKSFLESEANKAAVAALVEAQTRGLKTKRDELLGNQAALNKRFEQYGGLDGMEALAKQAADAEQARKKAEQEVLEKSGNVEDVKKHYSGQLSAAQQELADLKAAILNEKVSAKINAEIREAKGVPELLESHVRSRVRSEMVDGKLKITVLNASGGPMLKDDGKEASVKDLISELRTNAIYQRAFEAPTAGGTGGKESSGASVAANPWNPVTKNVTEQMKLYHQDKAAAQRMAAEFNVKLP